MFNKTCRNCVVLSDMVYYQLRLSQYFKINGSMLIGGLKGDIVMTYHPMRLQEKYINPKKMLHFKDTTIKRLTQLRIVSKTFTSNKISFTILLNME